MAQFCQNIQSATNRQICAVGTLRKPLSSPKVSLRVTRRAQYQHRKVQAATIQSEGAEATVAQPIKLTESALRHLKKLRGESGGDKLLLRVGVKSGGCSGMSYTMDFEEPSNVADDDSVMEHEGFKLVCDAMSLLYLFGMELDYSNKLIGGGFQFQNPNATSNCGCGKSFGV